MNLYAVSFFGHRQIDNIFVIEQSLETIIQELLLTKEYVEFFVVMESLISLSLQLSADVNEPSVMITAHLFWYCLTQQQNIETTNNHSMNIMTRLRSAPNLQKGISSRLIKPEIVLWLTVRTW